MSKDKPKKPKSIDDLFKDMQDTHSKDLDAAFKAHDSFTKEENMNHWYNNVFSPAQQGMYDVIKIELDKTFENDDDAKTEMKKEEVKKAVTAGLKKYFEKAHPGILDKMKDLGLDEKDEYDYLTGMYDEHVGAGKIEGVESIRSIEAIAKNKKVTVGHLKKYVDESKGKQIEGALKIMNNKYVQHHFGHFHPTEIAAYLKPKLEKVGYEIDDKLGYASAKLDTLVQLRKGLVSGEGHAYLKKKEDKEKK